MEPVQALGTGGFIHDYAEIGRRLWHVKTKHLPGKGQIIPALVCPDSVVYDVTSGTFDGSGPGGEFVPGARRPLPSIARYKAIHAAMVEYFREELALLPGRDWADIRYRRAQSCNCPTCRGRRDQRD